MRKAAGLKRGSKKKQQEETSPSSQKDGNASVTSNSTSGERRKPSNDEAALTSKNYRLAKELSELRVRHRDETKNVTRLTMENMNLASRCREAISHVAMLKKELAMHQKRASEALAVQRQQQNQRTASNHSDSGVLSELSDLARPTGNSAPSSTDVAVEMDRMDRIMASHAPPPPPPQKDGDEGDDEESPQKGGEGESDTSPTSSKSSSSSPEVEAATPETTRAPPSLFPHTASPKPKHRLNYNDDYPGDVAPHKASHESSLPAVQDEEEETAAPSEQGPSHAREVANIKLSSIDAFEASFDTAFPSSFASPKEGERTSEIYNPFFSSPQKKGLGTKSTLTRETVPEGDVVAASPERTRKWGTSVRSPRNSNRKNVEGGENGSDPKTPDDVDRFEPRSPERDTESSTRMPDPSSSPKIVSRASNSAYGATGEYQTPPHFHPKAQEQQPVEKPVEQPKRPEKSISASARARYEKALQPRGYHSRMKDPSPDRALQVETGGTIDSTEQAKNSPGTVLRRLQQRRAKADRFQPTMDANSNPISRTTTTSRSLRHPPVLATENGEGGPQSPFDDSGRNTADRRGSGRNAANGSSYSTRTSQNEAENNYQKSRSQTYPAAKKLSPDSMNAEIRALDAMAGSYQKPVGDSPTGSDFSHNSGSSNASSSSRYAALKQRRSVKQPVSYAEPSLNSKMRRGDEYFPRRTSETEDDPASPASASSPEDVNGSSRTRGSSGSRGAGANSEEVLKDLGAPVRS